MSEIQSALNRALIFYICFVLTMLLLTIFCAIYAKKKESMALFSVAIAIVTIIYCATIVVPFMRDYFSSNVVQVEGTYVNTLGDQSKSISSILGIYSVTVETNEELLALTTLPLSGKSFPAGEYRVIAWYMPDSSHLVHIEICI